MYSRLVASVLSVLIAGASAAMAADAESPSPAKVKIRFKKIQLDDQFRSEGVAAGDFNGDGKLDVAAGSVYFAAPDWEMVVIDKDAKTFDGAAGYSNSFCNFVDDLNGDGRDDLIVVDFPGAQTRWLENPGEAGGIWKRHIITPITNNESPSYVDVDGDGKRELLCGFAEENADGPDRYIGLVVRPEDPTQEWIKKPISEVGAPGSARFSHGIGAGDVNGDGRNDIMVIQGWWEQPEDKSATPWKFHKAQLGELCSQMYAYDFDGDGDNDILSTSAHKVGMWWHEQTDEGWKTHLIDDSFSQTHALQLVDINGDGLMDFVTGKRFWAHGPKGDIDPNADAVVFWYELTRRDGKPVWIPHQIDHNSGVGTQFEVVDMDGDGLLDVITSNKKGTFVFLQQRG